MSKPTKAQWITALDETARAAVEYVGMANYAERERAALRAVAYTVRTGKVARAEDFEA